MTTTAPRSVPDALLPPEPTEADWGLLCDWCEERGDSAFRLDISTRAPSDKVHGWSWRTDACDNPFDRDHFVLPDRVFLLLQGEEVAVVFLEGAIPRTLPVVPRICWKHYPDEASALRALRDACVRYAEGLEWR